MNVAVLMGGPSEEHAISLKSGHGVDEALSRQGHRVHPVEIPQAIGVEEATATARLALQQLAPDVVFIALHGRFGEDGLIQQLCEELHLAYVGSGPQASRLGMDKIASRRRFEQAGLVVPRWRVLVPSAGEPLDEAPGWSYPLVVKPSGQGSSLGVSIVPEPGALAAAVDSAAQFDSRVLIEEFIRGREVTAGILGDQPLPVVEIRPRAGFFDYRAKYTSGLTEYLVPAPLPSSAARATQAAGLAAHRALGCRHLSRADLILREDGVPVLLEVNTIPGFTPTSLLPKAAACAGIGYDALCEQLILMACPHTKRPAFGVGVVS
jgi:D-alanine--D-alanine ligase